MRIHSLLLICLVVFLPLQAYGVERSFNFGSQYWYSSDMFGGQIFVGNVKVVSSKADPEDLNVTKYRFRVTEILGTNISNPAKYRVGDVFHSETYREIRNGAAVVCLGAYPIKNEKLFDTVIDGAFPLMVDPKVELALKLVREHGTDPRQFTKKDFDSVKELMKYPEMYLYQRESSK